MKNITNIFVFKTNINTHHDRLVVKEALYSRPDIHEWSVDLQDCDKVLRIVTPNDNPREIINLITETGYECHELE